MFERLRQRRVARRQAREFAAQRKAVGKNGWRCHVCKDYRPDDKISVRSRLRMLGTVSFQENIRYCNDRPECKRGSVEVTFLP